MTVRVWGLAVIAGLVPGILVACGSLSNQASIEAAPKPASSPTTVASPPSPSQIALKQVEDIDQIVTETLTENGPGVAVLVLKNNQVLHAQGYGLANIEQNQAITPETMFDLASVSKQVTAMAILKLVQAEKIDLDSPVTEYVPQFRDRSKSITVRQLLIHTSGLADYTSGDWEGTDEEFAQLDLEKHLLWLNQQQPHRPPGEKYEYNNSGYALLALIVQRVAEKPFWQFAQDELFAPLGMTQTQIFHKMGQRIPKLAQGYLVDKDGEVQKSSSPSVIQGDGNVFSSIADLARYDIALRTGRLISPELKAEAFSPGQLNDESVIENEGEGYGLGWSITEDYVHHSGSWYGTSTYYRHYLQQPVTIIVLSNDEKYAADELADQIAGYLKL